MERSLCRLAGVSLFGGSTWTLLAMEYSCSDCGQCLHIDNKLTLRPVVKEQKEASSVK
jgi:hypothetical protein